MGVLLVEIAEMSCVLFVLLLQHQSRLNHMRCFQGYNVRTGAKYFADTLAANGGNFFLTLGGYNGWEKGMNVVSTFSYRLLFPRSKGTFPRPTLLVCAGPPAVRRTISTSRCLVPWTKRGVSNDSAHSLFQTANGWLLNKDAYSLRLGKYFNLDGC